MVVNKIKIPDKSKEQDWENPSNPEKAEDQRDIEQLLRQKHEAERRKDTLSDSEEKKSTKKQ